MKLTIRLPEKIKKLNPEQSYDFKTSALFLLIWPLFKLKYQKGNNFIFIIPSHLKFNNGTKLYYSQYVEGIIKAFNKIGIKKNDIGVYATEQIINVTTTKHKKDLFFRPKFAHENKNIYESYGDYYVSSFVPSSHIHLKSVNKKLKYQEIKFIFIKNINIAIEKFINKEIDFFDLDCYQAQKETGKIIKYLFSTKLKKNILTSLYINQEKYSQKFINALFSSIPKDKCDYNTFISKLKSKKESNMYFFTFELTYNKSNPGTQMFSNILIQFWKNLGINCYAKGYDWNKFLKGISTNKFDAYIISHVNYNDLIKKNCALLFITKKHFWISRYEDLKFDSGNWDAFFNNLVKIEN